MIFILIMLGGVHAHIREGVEFIGLKEISWVSETHTLISHLNMTKILAKITELERSILYTQRVPPNQHGLAVHFKEQLNQMSTCLRMKRNEMEEFLQINEEPKTNRTKRSLAGRIIASLFDLASNEDVEGIVQQINRNEKDIEETVNKLASIVKLTNRQVHRITVAEKKAALTIKAIGHHFKKTDAILANISTELVMAESVDFLEGATQVTLTEVDRILQMLGKIVITNEIGTETISAPEMQKVLLNIQEHWELMFPPTSRFLKTYYTIGQSQIKIFGEQVFVITQIPLKSEPEFDLIETIPFWVPYEGSPWVRKVRNVK